MVSTENHRTAYFFRRFMKIPIRYFPLVMIFGIMKITILISLASQQRAHQILYQQQQQPQHRFLRVKPSGNTPLEGSTKTVTEGSLLTAEELTSYWNLTTNLETSSITPSQKNRTQSSAIWLVYNRIPRSGGLTLVHLMEDLGTLNRFSHQNHQYRTPWRRLLTEDEQKNLVTWFEYQHMPKSYDRHLLFVNFTKHQRYVKNLHPVYINLMRDPIEREYSVFRGKRSDPMEVSAEMRRRDSLRPGSGNEWYTKSFEDCVLSDDVECLPNSTDYVFGRSIPYFCGQSPECLSNSRWALQRAKLNLEYEYSVVGILENMNQTLSVLEHYIPRFFKGAVERYYSTGYARRHENRYMKKKSPLSPLVRQKLQQNLALEYELYEFARQRLYLQQLHVEQQRTENRSLP